MTNQSPAERILRNYRKDMAWCEHQDDFYSQADYERAVANIESKAKTQLRDALLEQVIGEYEATQPSFSNHSDISEIKDMATRDELRAEQRKALEGFFQGEENGDK